MFRSMVKAVARHFAHKSEPVPEVILGDVLLVGPVEPVTATQELGLNVTAAENFARALQNRSPPVPASVRTHDRSATENAIRMRAYQKWENAGKPKGHQTRFWLEAKDELLGGQ